MLFYKLGLEKSKPELLEALAEYYSDKKESNNVLGINNGLKDLEFLSYDNAYEAYILTQIKIVESLPSVINDHIFMLNVGDDIDIVLEDFELEVYRIKKDVYCNLKEWDTLLDHVDYERISEITSNPQGYGDKILKELFWIRKFEEKHL